MIVLLFLSLVFMFERIIMLRFVYAIDFKKFLINLKKMVAAEDLDRAISFCKSVSRTALPHIALRACEAAETDPTRVKGVIEEEALDFIPKVEARTGTLPAIAALVVLIGVLGTINGLWTAFQSIEILDTAQKQATLGKGIALALNPLAMGIIVSIFILIGHYIVRALAINMIERVHQGIAVLNNMLVPQEMVAVAASSAATVAAPTGTFDAVGEQAPVQPTPAPQGAATNENIDTAAVEDIKDEEEII
jgi:biopolymer transport protein ExbB/TolQ